ncbi:Mitochondrial copper homeostasis protein [Serendipita sp. 400]|nr:Mitochondrial copper homeostasis protein [Serendipita sp. 400]
MSTSQNPPSATKTPEDWKVTLKNKGPSEFRDPCLAASQASMECLNRHDYNRDDCLEYFRAYRECKAAWLKQRREDRRSGRTDM